MTYSAADYSCYAEASEATEQYEQPREVKKSPALHSVPQ